MDSLIPLFTTTDGRISRKQWWTGTVVLIVLNIVLYLILSVIGLGSQLGWLSLIIYAIYFYPAWCIGLKRRQDRDNNGMDFKILMGIYALLTIAQAFGIGMSPTDLGNGMVVMAPAGWMMFVQFAVGIFGIYMLVQLGFLKGTPGPNSYGADPLGGHAVAA